jgi:hypothetical protein
MKNHVRGEMRKESEANRQIQVVIYMQSEGKQYQIGVVTCMDDTREGALFVHSGIEHHTSPGRLKF